MATDFKAGDRVTWQAPYGRNVYVGTVTYATKATLVVKDVIETFLDNTRPSKNRRFTYRKEADGFYPVKVRAKGNTESALRRSE